MDTTCHRALLVFTRFLVAKSVQETWNGKDFRKSLDT
jgi:hypothetical protein